MAFSTVQEKRHTCSESPENVKISDIHPVVETPVNTTNTSRSSSLLTSKHQNNYKECCVISARGIFPCSQISHERPPTQSSKLRVRTDKSAMVLFSIVVLFLLAHGYRIALKTYEIASPNAHTIEKFKICFALKRYLLIFI